jgi:uncharacterized membrane protein YgaE (UPF0421/DUF939 family)
VDPASPTARAARLVDQAGRRSRSVFRERLERLRVLAPAVLQTAAAAAGAWLLATEVVGHQRPFLAPVAAIIALASAYGQRTRRAVEIVVGQAVGVLVAELVLLALGSGAAQIGLVVALAMVAAIMLGGGRLVLVQAATGAALIATVAVPDHLTLARVVDALAGGAVALFVGLILFPIDPVRLMRRHRAPLLEELAAVLDEIRVALATADHDVAADALASARGLDGSVARFTEAVAVGIEVGRGSPLRRRTLTTMRRNAVAAAELDMAVRNARVLARGAIRAADLAAHLPEPMLQAVGDLADAVRGLGAALDDPAAAGPAREAALRAAGRASIGLEQTANLSASVVVGQVRSTATDLLRALGLPADEAVGAVREAAARAAAEQLAEP